MLQMSRDMFRDSIIINECVLKVIRLNLSYVPFFSNYRSLYYVPYSILCKLSSILLFMKN